MSDVTRDQVQQAIRSITCDVMNYQPPAKAGSDTSLLNGKLTDRICELFDVDDTCREWTIFGETDGEAWGIGIPFGTRAEAEECLRRETWMHNKGGYIVSRTISEWKVIDE